MKQELEQLFEVLDTLVRLHEQMIATLDRQLAAARAADSQMMRQCQEEIERLVGQVARAEIQRRSATGNLAVEAGLPGATAGRGVTASRLAAALPEPARGRLTEQTARLRERVQEVDRLNRILADVSRRVLLHLRSAYETVAHAAGTTGVYAADGRLRQAQRSTVFEAVG
jgi:hypothetical protein